MIRGDVMKRGASQFLLIVLTTLTVALSGCSSDKAGESASLDGSTGAGAGTATGTADTASDASADNLSKIVVGIPQDIDSLDPHYATGAGTKEILFNVFEGLVKPDSNGNLIPAVASEVNISEDNKVYTFTLRDGIKFHDGSSVTVEDIKYSIDRNRGADGSEPLISSFSNIDSVNITDDSHVEIVLGEADSEFLPLE